MMMGNQAQYRWVGLAKDDVSGPPWNYYVLDLDGKEMALCQMPDGEAHAEQIVDALNEDYDKFNLRWNADMRAIKRWQAANPGNDLVWPDHADLVVWLLEQLDAASAMSGRSPETEGLSPQDASAAPEGGDAQTTPSPSPSGPSL